MEGTLIALDKKKRRKIAALYNLAEIQNDCSKMFKDQASIDLKDHPGAL